MPLPEGVSVLALVSVFIIGVGVLLHIVGLATPEWSALHEGGASGSFGLWKICSDDNIRGQICKEYSSEETHPEDFLNSIRACEAFAILGMLASVLGLALAAISVLLPMMGKPKNAMFPVISLAGCGASFVFILIAIVVWGAKVHADYLEKLTLKIGYSFILSIIGGILIENNSKMPLPEGVSVLALVSMFIIGVGVLLHIVGLATPEWSALHEGGASGSFGLWKICSDDNVKGQICMEYSSEQNYPEEFNDSVKACDAFAILGMVASFLGLALAAISVILPIVGKPKNAMLPVISLAGCGASFVFILIAIIVWGAKVHADYLEKLTLKIGYSFILSIIGGILIGVGGVLAFIANKGVSYIQ
ncbi:unnamed protein product [Lymnaea stagnalis]|uniref:Uncharacterized protein n=1 Tax=Lymnaea stagnalis TaxID=6523 RepID=A0AAV2III9_LYMST